MRTIVFIILTFSFLSSLAQTIETKPVSSEKKKEFKNQGEQEDSWAEQFFEKNYSKQNFDKYSGDIIVNGDGFTYSDQTLVVTNTTKKLRSIFLNGIFYPSIITGQTKTKLKGKEELDTLSVGEKALYNITRTDSLVITDLEEMTFLNKTPAQKKFRFWLFRKGILNPTVCFIELTNKMATEKTDIESFISGATLTFYKEGWIII